MASAEELRYEIADTRAELGQTLDAIGDRVSPGRMIERRKNRFVVGMRSARTASLNGVRRRRRRDRPGPGVGRDLPTRPVQRSTRCVVPRTARPRAQGSPMLAGAVAWCPTLVAPRSAVADRGAARRAGDGARPNPSSSS